MARSSPSTRPGARTSACSRSALGAKSAPDLVYQAFDLLYLDGRLAARRRRSRTASACSRACSGRTRGSASRPTSRARARPSTRPPPAQGLEGIVAKLRRSRYEPGRRSNAWLKIKIRPEQELVVGGWTPGDGQRPRPRRAGRRRTTRTASCRFGGKVGSGFTGRDPQGRCSTRSRRWASTTRRSTRRRPRTIGAAGAATSSASPGSGPSSSSARSWAAGRATAWSASPRSRASRRAATR